MKRIQCFHKNLQIVHQRRESFVSCNKEPKKESYNSGRLMREQGIYQSMENSSKDKGPYQKSS